MSMYITTLATLMNDGIESFSKFTKDDVVLAFYEEHDAIPPMLYTSMLNCNAKLELKPMAETIGSIDNLLFAAGLLIGAGKTTENYRLVLPDANEKLKAFAPKSFMAQKVSFEIADSFDSIEYTKLKDEKAQDVKPVTKKREYRRRGASSVVQQAETSKTETPTSDETTEIKQDVAATIEKDIVFENPTEVGTQAETLVKDCIDALVEDNMSVLLSETNEEIESIDAEAPTEVADEVKESESVERAEPTPTIETEETTETIDSTEYVGNVNENTETAVMSQPTDASDEIAIPDGLFEDDEDNLIVYKEFCASIPNDAIPAGYTLNQFAPCLLKTLQQSVIISEAASVLETMIGDFASESMNIISQKGFFHKLKNYAIELEC